MVFNSSRIKPVLLQYQNDPDFMVPRAVYLARSPKLENERIYIESHFQQVSLSVQKQWLGRLLSTDDGQHLGAWFEIMLFGWMKEVGDVEVDPHVVGNNPDLSIIIEKCKVFVEAKVIQRTNSEKDRQILNDWIFWALKKIKKPHAITITQVRASKLPDLTDFCTKVDRWLETSAQERYVYEDGFSTIVLDMIGEPKMKSDYVVAISSVGEAKWISSEPLKIPLRDKASQHQAIRQASLPYIIAVFLESPFLSAEEVVQAWFGQEVWSLNPIDDEYKVVGSHIDRSGIHFFGSEIRHKSVSGTLVFTAEFIETKGRHYLKSWYIENPFARTSISFANLPVNGYFKVLERSDTGIKMGWQTGRDSYVGI